MTTISQQKMQELLAKARATLARNEQAAADALEQQVSSVTSVDFTNTGIDPNFVPEDNSVEQPGEEAAVDFIKDVISNIALQDEATGYKQHGTARDVELNTNQQQFLNCVVAGEDVVLIGAAGTGKTTSMKKTSRALVDSGRLKTITEATKWLQYGKPGVVILSFTRKAVNNIRHAVIDELKAHTLTVHKVLEFAPVIYEIEDPNSKGDMKTSMKFEPKRNVNNPLPRELEVAIFEESSMIGVDLYGLFEDAMPHPHQEIFLGDIQQLPPVFGQAILGYKMLELKVIELTQVYRQARDNPILDLAWKILEGDKEVFSPAEVEVYDYHHPATGKTVKRKRYPRLDALTKQQYDDNGELIGSLKFQVWQQKLSDELGALTASKQFTTWADEGYYNPNEDIILCPFNKAFGTVELNQRISQHLGVKRGATVHEVIAGYNKHYLAVGDRVLYDKEDAFIVSINRNVDYFGKSPQPGSQWLDRWGSLQKQLTAEEKLQAEMEASELSEDALERMMAEAAGSIEQRVTSASHDIVIRFAYGDGEEKVLNQAAQVNDLLGGYAITVHKGQGSEWRRGFFVLHRSHAVALKRELIYTGVTRFREQLHIICEPDTFYLAMQRQAISGNTLQEKAEFFKGKVDKQGEMFDESKIAKNGGVYTPGKIHIKSESVRSEYVALPAYIDPRDLERWEYEGGVGAIKRYTETDEYRSFREKYYRELGSNKSAGVIVLTPAQQRLKDLRDKLIANAAKAAQQVKE